MADNKKSIVVYADWLDNFESLSDEEAGRLVKHFFRYVNDLNPVPVDRITEISFIPLKNTLKRDLRKWETKLEERSISGRMGNLKRWNPDLHTQVEAKTITLQEAEVIAVDRKKSLSDKKDTVATENIANIAVSDSVSVSVSVNDILLKKETKKNIKEREEIFKSECKVFLNQYGSETLKSFFNYWSEPNQSKTKMRYELEKTFDISRRLTTWKKNERNYQAKKIDISKTPMI